MIRQKKSITNFTIPSLMIILMIIPFLYLLFASWDKSWEYDHKEINAKIIDTLKIIDRYGGIENSVSGYSTSFSNSRNNQLIRQKWLLQNATNKDLLNLIDFPKDHIRAIAFKGLCQRNHPDIFRILIQFLTEEERTISNRNFSEPKRLVEYCFEQIMGYELPSLPPRPPQEKYLKILSEKQREFIFDELKNKI